MKNQNIKVAIAPWGGNATSLVRRLMNAYMRPDVVLGASGDICHMPKSTMRKAWKHRTGTDLDMTITLNDNLVRFVHNSKRPILFSGGVSKFSPFLTINSIRAMCIVRKPVYAYCSMYSRRHPEKAEAFGGIDTEKLALWYTERWNNIVYDFLESGNPIIRFEHWTDDMRRQDVGPFKKLINAIDHKRASTVKPISKEVENLVFERTRELCKEVNKFHKRLRGR
jgi:hypothetical protein